MSSFVRNVVSGAQLALLRRSRFVPTLGQLVLLLACGWGMALFADWLQFDEPISPSLWGIVLTAARNHAWLAVLAVIVLLSRRAALFLPLAVALAAAEITLWWVWLAISHFAPAHVPNLYSTIEPHLELVFVLWQVAIFVRAWQGVQGKLDRGMPVYLALYVGMLFVNMKVLPDYPMLEPVSPHRGATALNVEGTYYRQPSLLAESAAKLTMGIAGRVELFELGFGGYGEENVFKHEVEQVADIIGKQFSTTTHSLQLINNLSTVTRVPLANMHNLVNALKLLGDHMQRDEDILFLFLTSHGSHDGEFAVELGDLGLQSLTPAALRRVLDESGIVWRVVVVSACYSGKFLSPLAEPHTLVITASAADKASFGCAHHRRWTYFGEAYFRDALASTSSFIEAFERATQAIAAREKREGKVPSEPQMRVGDKIKMQLDRLKADR